MAADELQQVIAGSRALEAEVTRLRRELKAAEARLEEQAAYYRGELETTRQRVEGQHLRLQADEVSKRRRAEEQVLELKAGLRQAREEAERAKRRYEEMARQLVELEEASKRRTQAEVDRVQEAARNAWRGAEEELAHVEEELASTKRLLAQERERCKQLEQRASRASQPNDDNLIASLKEALWATAQARKRAETELESLKTEGPPVGHRGEAPAPKKPKEDFEGAYRVVSANEWQGVVIGNGESDLNEDFMIMPGDASLDEETFQQLQERVASPPRAKAAEPARRSAFTPRPAAATPRPAAAPSRRPLPDAVDMQDKRQGVGRVVLFLLVGLGLTGLVVWLGRSALLTQWFGGAG